MFLVGTFLFICCSLEFEFTQGYLCHVSYRDMPRHLGSSEQGRFRIQAQNLALTYPRCGLDARTLLGLLKEKLPPMAYCEVVVEEHQEAGEGEDLGRHLHALVCLESRLRTSNARFADVASFHGNYKPLKTVADVRRWKDYLSKEPLDIAVMGELPTHFLPPGEKNSKSAVAQSLILQGATIRDLVSNPELSGWVLLNLRKLKEFTAFVEAGAKSTEPWPELMSCLGENLRIQGWIKMWLIDRTPRYLKAPQLWIHGKPNLGKTTLKMTLMKHCKVYVPPMMMSGSTMYLEDYEDDIYDLCIIDEYKGQFPVYLLNNFLDGSEVRFHVKGGSVIKRQNIPTIIMSNYSPKECYPNVDDMALDALMTRIRVINPDTFISVFKDK